jgi:hypothetical protein
MFAVSRSQNWFLKKRKSTATMTATNSRMWTTVVVWRSTSVPDSSIGAPSAETRQAQLRLTMDMSDPRQDLQGPSSCRRRNRIGHGASRSS